MAQKLRSKPVLGVDVSASSVKLIELHGAGTSYRAQCYAVEPMPPNAIAENAVVDVAAAGEAVKRAYRRSGSRLRDVAMAIGGATVITKTIQLPVGLSPREQEQQVEVSAARQIPFPLDEVAYDFEIVGPTEGHPESIDVLLVATRRENVEQRQAILEVAGLRGYIMDCEVFALENAFHVVHPTNADGNGSTVALVDFGAMSTSFNVLHGGRVVYTRDQVFGGRQLTEEIMRRYQLSFEDAERAQHQGGLPDDYNEAVLGPFLADMANQVNRALQFFLASTTEYAGIDEVMICGGCAAVAGAAERIGERVGRPTSIANPLGVLKAGSRSISQGAQRDGPSLMVACGLALRSFD